MNTVLSSPSVLQDAHRTAPNATIAHLFTAQVFHKRFKPKVNEFKYGLYYLALPVNHLEKCHSIPINRSGLISFWEKDHGSRAREPLQKWIYRQLKHIGLDTLVNEILLLAMPRVMGYGFNPVSFWLCFNKTHKLIAVVCEVNNTFGETHCYLCRNPNSEEMKPDHWFLAEKVFHVSPFLPREGQYRFKFQITAKKLSISIHHYDSENKKKLITSLYGTLTPLTRFSLFKTSCLFPFITIKTITLIHWQALKLLLKKCRFHKKPEPKPEKLTVSKRLYVSKE